MEIRTEIEIDASPAAVWKVLTDFALYPEWNPFIPTVAGSLEVGATLDVLLTPPNGSDLRVRTKLLVVDADRELRWRGQLLFPQLFAGEHFFRLIELAPEKTRFIHGEDFTGILVRLLGGTITKAARGYVFMNQALKRRVEEG